MTLDSTSRALFPMVVKALELRVSPQGIKAKWVQVLLRKVETVLLGGQANTFYDYVGLGQSYLWKASGEYTMLHSVRLGHAPPYLVSFYLSNIRSGIFLSIYGFPRPSRPVFYWTEAVCERPIFPVASCDWFTAGIKYELVGTICTKGKRCVR
jgi:hypothetical protein